MGEPVRHDPTWTASFVRELFRMPRRHVLVFLVATVLLRVVDEFVEGWHLIHLLELLGVMVFLYLLWAAWRARSSDLSA